MRYTINQINVGENELILNYSEETAEVQDALLFMQSHQRKLVGKVNNQTVVFSPEEILYVEKVDEKTFVYTWNNEIQVNLSLNSIERMLDRNYFRCSKSMILNVSKVEKLKSMPSNRIDARLQNGEHVIISRTYASDFRRLLRGDR